MERPQDKKSSGKAQVNLAVRSQETLREETDFLLQEFFAAKEVGDVISGEKQNKTRAFVTHPISYKLP